jgi:hypothetical protein
MHQIEFLGRVYPAGWTLTLSNVPNVVYTDANVPLIARFEFSVVNSEIEVTVSFNTKVDNWLLILWMHAVKLLRAQVNLAAFQMAVGPTIVLDHWRENGVVDRLVTHDPQLPPLCTAFSDSVGFNEALALVMSEQPIIKALEDLVTSISFEDNTTINCARSVEAIRQMVAGYDLTPGQQWPIFRDQLNISREYVELIMEHSLDHRHGKPTYKDGAVSKEITMRAWTIMDRFLHYRLGGNAKLDTLRFPAL